MAKFTKYNNPNKKHHRRNTYNPAAWDGAGTRERYIETLIRLEAQKLAAEDTHTYRIYNAYMDRTTKDRAEAINAARLNAAAAEDIETGEILIDCRTEESEADAIG